MIWTGSKTKLEEGLKKMTAQAPTQVGLTMGVQSFADNPVNRLWSVIDHEQKAWTWALAALPHNPKKARIQLASEGTVLVDSNFSCDYAQGIHSTYWQTLSSYELERRIPLLQLPLSYTSDLASETRAFEWLRVSLQVVLKQAIEAAQKNPEALLSAQIFSGPKAPDFALDELRLIVFSLDTSWIFHPQGVLEVRVTNQLPHGAPKNKPDLVAEFGHLRHQAYDLLIQTLRDLRPSLMSLTGL
jgi:hypothetical protein